MKRIFGCLMALLLGCVTTDSMANTTNPENSSATDDGATGENAQHKTLRHSKFKKLEAGTRILLSFPAMPATAPFTEDDLNRFRSSLGKSDELGIVVADRKQQLLPLTEEAQVSVPSAKVMAGFQSTSGDSGMELKAGRHPVVDMDETIRGAVAQLSDLEGLLKAVVLVIDRPVQLSAEKRELSASGTGGESDSDPATAEMATLSTLLALNNIILYAVFYENVNNDALARLTVQSGGKNIYLSNRVTLNDALYMAYDSILLRTIQLAPQKALYEGDEICSPRPEAGEKQAGTDVEVMSDTAANTYVTSLLIAVLGISIVVLLLVVSLWQRNSKPSQPALEKANEADDKKDTAPPAFSKLTIGINRVRNSFSDMESKLHALSSDLDDFGSENWEMQKKIVAAYAEISRELFLLFDHLTLVDDVERTEETVWVIRKIEQAFENNGIEEIIPEAGSRFHSKFHVHAGERASDEKAGTVLEVVRNGYQRKGFISDEPFVLRQAEVIVSTGKEEGK